MKVTRRNFLAGSLLALPGGAKVLGGTFRMPLKESEYTLLASGWPKIRITTYTNGSVLGWWGGEPLALLKTGEWKNFSGRVGESSCDIRVRRVDGQNLDIDYIKMQCPRNAFIDNFKSVEPWGDSVSAENPIQP